MPKTRIPSPSRSQGSTTPRRNKPRRSRSVCSPSLSNASGRLTSIIDQFKEKNMESFSISPMKSRWSVLTDNTDIDEPQRKSWWKNLNENSQDFMEVLEDNKDTDSNNPIEDISDIEIISQENKNYSSLDLPESSDNESIHSIVLTQRELFLQKENKPHKKFGQLIGARETLTKLHKSNTTFHEKIIIAGTKDLFQGTKKSKPVFSAALLNMSANKTTVDKTAENIVAEPKIPVKNIFGHRPAKKRKNIFADFIVSDSEHEVSDIQVLAKHSLVKRTKNDKILDNQVDVDQNIDIEQSEKVNLEEMVDDDECENEQMNENQAAVNKSNKNQELNQAQNKFHGLVGSRESIDKLHPTNTTHYEEVVTAGTKHLFPNIESNTIFSSTLLHISPKKTAADELKPTVKNMFSNRSSNKHRNIFADFLESESEHEISEIVPEKEKSTTVDPPDVNKELRQQSDAIENVGGESTQGKQQITATKTNFNLSTENNQEEIVNEKEMEDGAESEEDAEMKYEESDEEVPEKSKRQEKGYFDSKHLEVISKGDIKEFNKNIDNCQNEINKSFKEVQKEIEIRSECIHKFNQKNVEANVNQESSVEMNDHQHGDQNQRDENIDKQKSKKDSQDEENRKNQKYGLTKKSSAKIKEIDPMGNIGPELHDDEETSANSKKIVEVENYQETDESVDVDKATATDRVSKSDDQEEIEVHNYENYKNVSYKQKNNSRDDGKIIENEEDNAESEVEDEYENNGVDNNDSEIDDEIQENELDNGVSEINDEIEEDKVESEVENEINKVESEVEDENEENQVDEDERQVEDVNEENEIDKDESEVEHVNEIDNEEIELYTESEESEGDNGENEVDDENENAEVDDDENEVDDENENAEVDDDENELNDVRGENEDGYENEENAEVHTKVASSDEVIEESPDVTHNTTSRNRKKIKSPEVVLHDKTKQQISFIAKGRNTSVRETKSLYKDLNITPSLAPPRDSIGLSAGDSSAEGSGWDSHRTTRKTLRQTFGKDFTPRKSLRALVMEKSAKQTMNIQTLQSETALMPQANSTEYPQDSFCKDDETIESDHEVSKRTRQTTLETYLQKIKQQNIEKKLKMEQAIRDSLKAPPTQDTLSLFKIPSKPPPRRPKPTSTKPKKQVKSLLFDELPSEVIEDMKYKPPKRFQPSNASWITKRLYKYLESKLEPKYDYKARVRAEKLVETIYHFAKNLRRHDVAPVDSVDVLKHELARLEVVKTHFEFYEFFHEFMPREIRVKVVPDIVNKIPLPRHGVFADILRGTTVQG